MELAEQALGFLLCLVGYTVFILKNWHPCLFDTLYQTMGTNLQLPANV